MATMRLFLLVLISATVGRAATISCEKCFAPTFQGRILYLPFCNGETTFSNLCDAICAAEAPNLPSKGSCDKCETKKCSAVFLPVCSPDQKTIYPNVCQAKCAGIESVDCKGLNFIFPGKSPLPPNWELPSKLQNVGGVEDEDQKL